jgi:hypothetical protein
MEPEINFSLNLAVYMRICALRLGVAQALQAWAEAL